MANPIGYVDRTLNVTSGCAKISPACDHCWAERFSHRLAGRFGYATDKPFRVTLHPERMEEPATWRKQQRVFVSAMGDLFHKKVPFAYIDRVFDMIRYSFHTYLLLTKRPEQMEEYCKRSHWRRWPDNIWAGVTVESQSYDWRIDKLRGIPAAIRWVSIEPMLSRVDLSPHLTHTIQPGNVGAGVMEGCLDFVVAGPETGPGKRPCNPDWIEDLYEQCKMAGVPFWDKRRDGWLARELPG